jgi:hypothetical protein
MSVVESVDSDRLAPLVAKIDRLFALTRDSSVRLLDGCFGVFTRNELVQIVSARDEPLLESLIDTAIKRLQGPK